MRNRLAGMDSRSTWKIPWAALLTFTVLSLTSVAADFVHSASGLKFPASIEGRFQRVDVTEDGKRCSMTYAGRSGFAVAVVVHPAQPGVSGPTKLDGDDRSAASASFLNALNKRVGLLGEGLKGAEVVSQQRFQAKPSVGPVGMKTTVRGKLEGRTTNRELLLFERNGYFVEITTSCAGEDWLKTGLIYTDVAHFIGWPKVEQRPQPVSLHNGKGQFK